jgi:hypothetical protein
VLGAAGTEASPGAAQAAVSNPAVSNPAAPQPVVSQLGVVQPTVLKATVPQVVLPQPAVLQTAVLRQQDVLPDAFAAPARRYADPEFSVAALPRGILRHADLSACDFTGVRFTGRHRYLDCRFTGADLARIVLEAGSRAHQFVRCDFSGAQFAGSRLGFVLFHECDLRGSQWDRARLERVRFSDCQVEGVDWSGADLVDSGLPGGTAVPASPIPPAGGATNELGTSADTAPVAQASAAPPTAPPPQPSAAPASPDAAALPAPAEPAR